MIRRIIPALALAAILFCGIAAAVYTGDQIYILNPPADQIPLKIRATSRTLPWIEIVDGGTTKFYLPSTGIIPVAFGGTGASSLAGAGIGTISGSSLTNVTIVGVTMSGATNSDLAVGDPVWASSTKTLTTKTILATKTAIGIQAGSAVTVDDSTITNTFSSAYASPPIVVITTVSGTAAGTNYVSAVTTTNCIFATIGQTNVTVNYIAIGAPAP